MEWLVALVMVPAVVVTQWLAIRRSKEAAVILSRWAAGDGHKLLETRDAPGCIRDPSGFAGGQAVFFIRLVTASGNRRMGWARVGRGWALGPVANAVEVHWDEPGLAGGQD